MTTDTFVSAALTPAMRLLPPRMDSPEARAMIIAICLQESKLDARRQGGKGPARGYGQFEKAGINGVLTHRSTAAYAREVCAALDIEPTVAAVYLAIEYNDVLLACFARLLLWTLPVALPTQYEANEGWEQYLAAWRPGKPHEATWFDNFEIAWYIVQLDTPAHL